MDHLQEELLCAILAFLPSKDLKAVATTNSLLRPVAQRMLFRDVTLDGDKPGLAENLRFSPRLSRYVLHLSIVVSRLSPAPQSFYRAVKDALSLMHDLMSLSIAIPDQPGSSFLPTDLFFARLETLKASSFSLDANVLQFLRMAPGIVNLSLKAIDDGPPPHIPAHIVPQISSVGGSLSLVRALIHGRPVSSIFVTRCCVTVDDIHWFSKHSTAQVTSLDIKISTQLRPALRAISIAMPELRHVKITTTYEAWKLPCRASLDSTQEIVCNMPCLKSANISGVLWTWCSKANAVVSNILPLNLWLSPYDSGAHPNGVLWGIDTWRTSAHFNCGI